MDADLHQQIGKLEAHVEQLQKDVSDIKNDVKKMSEQMNKWRGAGVLLLIIGSVFGFMVDWVYRLLGR